MLLYSGDLRLNDDSHRVTVGADEINLTKKEYELLKMLLANKGREVSIYAISRDVFDSRASMDTIKVHVCNLRKKIGYWRISSVYGYGYMMQDVTYFQHCLVPDEVLS